MAKRQRRQSQSGRQMREVLDRLRDFDVEEVRLLCQKHLKRTGGSAGGRPRVFLPEND